MALYNYRFLGDHPKQVAYVMHFVLNRNGHILDAIEYMQCLIISHNSPSTCHNLLYFMQIVRYLAQFYIMMTCICAKLVSVAYANCLISLELVTLNILCVSLLYIWKSRPSIISKSRNKSPITKFSDLDHIHFKNHMVISMVKRVH